MLAKSESSSAEVAFDLLVSLMLRCRDLGYEFVVTDATNQWTGAAFEHLGAMRVYFAPYILGNHPVTKSDTPQPDTVSSPNGWLSDKDSGAMAYVVALN
jgi:hypothetical protein